MTVRSHPKVALRASRQAIGCRSILACVLAAAPLPLAAAGEGAAIDPTVYLLKGRSRDFLGTYIAVLGDLDGDGVTDFAASRMNPRSDSWDNPGRIDFVSGRTGETFQTWEGQERREFLGHAGIWAFPDTDGDRILELGMNVPFVGVQVVAFREGPKAVQFTIPADRGGNVDYQFLIVPDVDGDGVGEVVGASRVSILPAHFVAGRVRCYSGRTGEILWARFGTNFFGQLGAGLCVGGDEDGDGIPDILCSEFEGSPARIAGSQLVGAVHVLNSRTGVILRTLSAPGERYFSFGGRMASLGDRDGDGFPEVAIAAPYYHDPIYPEVGDDPRQFISDDGRELGWVGVFRLPSFEVLFSQKGRDPRGSTRTGDELGLTLSTAGDADGDGLPDILAGTNSSRPSGFPHGKLHVISGADGSSLATYEALADSPGANFFQELSPLGDVDGDGRAEFLASNPDEFFSDEVTERFVGGSIRLLRHAVHAPHFIRGDADGDGHVSLADAVAILEQAPASGCGDPAESTPCAAALDVNADGCLNHRDALELLLYLFGIEYFDRLAPSPPFPTCGAFYRLLVAEDLRLRHLDCRDAGACRG